MKGYPVSVLKIKELLNRPPQAPFNPVKFKKNKALIAAILKMC
jgi:hypothetical protein